MISYGKRIILLCTLIGVVVTLDLTAIKPRFPQQFIATIYGSQYNNANYPCLYDSINNRERCQLNNNVYRIRNFSINNITTFTETNYTTEFPSKCNVSTSINDAKLLNPNWFDKLNLSLQSVDKDSYSSLNIGLYSWLFTLKKPSLLEELPFAPKFIQLYDQRMGTVQFEFRKIRNIVGEIQTSDPDFTWPKTMRISFDTPGFDCTQDRREMERNPFCRQQYSWSFNKQPNFGMVASGAVSINGIFDALFTLPSFLPPCQNVDQNRSTEQEEEEE